MRILVCLLGILASAALGLPGKRVFETDQEERRKLDVQIKGYHARGFAPGASEEIKNRYYARQAADKKVLESNIEILGTNAKVVTFLALSAVLGLLASLLAVAGRGKTAALMFLVAGLAPVAIKTQVVIFTSGLLLCCLLSLLIRAKGASSKKQKKPKPSKTVADDKVDSPDDIGDDDEVDFPGDIGDDDDIKESDDIGEPEEEEDLEAFDDMFDDEK